MIPTFSREPLTPQWFEEAMPLLRLHYKEIAHYQDIPLDPDEDAYLDAEKRGAIRCFVARDQFGLLMGYAVFFVRYNIHYKTSLQAIQDVIYVDPNKRGIGARFIPWCDAKLKEEGVQVVYHHVKDEHNFGPLLERIGYKLIDHIYGRRLD